jgi:hypothetical protein
MAVAEHGSDAIRPALPAAAAMGALIRNALERAGVDAATATRLSFAEEAAAPFAANPDTAEVPSEDASGAPLANADTQADDFETKILAIARRFTGGQRPDFANSSFAELLAWSLSSRRWNDFGRRAKIGGRAARRSCVLRDAPFGALRRIRIRL